MIRFTGGNCPDDVRNKIESFIVDNSFEDNKFILFPGFCDVHVHLREPGFSYKETIESGSLASARGGYTSVCPMPNLNPVPDSLDNLNVELDAIKKANIIDVYPYASITVNQKGERLANMEEMSEYVIAFSDDGKGVQEEEMMRKAMLKAKELGKMIVAHCEDNSLLNGGYIHDGEYAKEHGHLGISKESEYKQIERDVRLAKETGCKYHVCHISCKESVEIIRKAKKEGVDVSCETAPHYLLLDESNLKEDGYFKMNPPIRGKEDKEALIEGIKDNTIEIIATDHAPHSKEEKIKGLKDSAFGIVGIETAFPLLYTELVKKGILTLDELINKLVYNPRKRFNIPFNGYSIWNLDEKYIINEDNFLSKGCASPFIGKEVYGVNYLTVSNNKTVYKK